MFAIDFFRYPAILLDKFYEWTGSFGIAFALFGAVAVLLITPLTLKSTKGMLEMQLLQPELRKLQQQHKGDRQALNAEMMKLYQEHKINPLASCLPLIAQAPVFIIVFRLVRGLTRTVTCNTLNDAKTLPALCVQLGKSAGEQIINPDHVAKGSKIYTDLVGKTEMRSFSLDLAKSATKMVGESLGRGLLYFGVVAFLAGLYWIQQRLVANRAVNPTMSATQQKLMQYLPVVFAVWYIIWPLGLVFCYISQTVLRIVQQMYITRRFYKGEDSLGTKAASAGQEARDLAKAENGGDAPKGFRAMLKEAASGPAAPKDAPSGRSTELRADGRPKNPGAKGAQPRKQTGAQRPAGNRPAASYQQPTPGTSSRHPKPKK